jgi:hypothetical protein
MTVLVLVPTFLIVNKFYFCRFSDICKGEHFTKVRNKSTSDDKLKDFICCSSLHVYVDMTYERHLHQLLLSKTKIRAT